MKQNNDIPYIATWHIIYDAMVRKLLEVISFTIYPCYGM